MSQEVITYKPPPTIREFIRDYRPHQLFYDWIVGPYGSSKTTALFFKLVYMAGLQEPGSDGIRHSRAVVVRNTASQLKDTTLNSWNYWFKDGIHGTWRATDKIFILKLGDIECEVLFRPLDTPDDVARVLSLEVTFAIIDEFVQIPREIIEALSGRLGRYPSNKDGGATNYGMWGASNPDTEDNWWYEHLHDTTTVQQIINLKEDTPRDNRNVRYYRQPSGLSPEAENLCNLPPYDCSNQYYTDLARGKSEAWINQFIHAMWGFTVRGKPVVPTFKPDMHISKKPLTFNPYLPLIIGIDPGLGGSALIFGQEDSYGRLLVLGELVQSGYGAERIISERLKPYLRRRFADADIYFAPDPAADNRSQTDEKSVVDVFRRHWPHRVKIETNNRLPKRLDAIESYTTRLTEAGPALLIDEKECPNLVRALRGGWRFELLGRGDINKPVPEKNASSHVGDAFGYLCRYFHRQNERGLGYTKHERVPINPQFASRGVNYNWKPVI